MKIKTFKMSFLAIVIAIFGVSQIFAANAPKYVFYVIGDGLGLAQRQLTEYYQQEITGNKNFRLKMNTMPIVGIATTHSADSFVTRSGAAACALASGKKSNNGSVGMLPDGTKAKTLTNVFKNMGWATGVITNMRMTHATPASFLAHNPNRDNENEIAEDVVTSGVDLLIGGGYSHFAPKNGILKSKRKDNKNLISDFQKKGYSTFIGENSSLDFIEYNPKRINKVVYIPTDSHMPYEMDRTSPLPSLSNIVAKGIDILKAQNEPTP
jgi:alkaline phosphatase